MSARRVHNATCSSSFNEAVGFHRRKPVRKSIENKIEDRSQASMRPSAFTDGNTGKDEIAS